MSLCLAAALAAVLAESPTAPTEAGSPVQPAVEAVAPASEAPAGPRFEAKLVADAYVGHNYLLPPPRAADGTGGNALRAFDSANGFGLAWAGADLSASHGAWAGQVDLRFGPAAVVSAGADAGPGLGLGFVKQAYVRWKPQGESGPLSLDLGKFDQPFGTEVPDAALNANYTRSFLFWLAQPVFFTGARATWAVTPKLDVLFVAANGWNVSFEDRWRKSLLAQVRFRPMSSVELDVGYGAELEPAWNGDALEVTQNQRHLVDVCAIAQLGPTRELRANANVVAASSEPDGASGALVGGNVSLRQRLGERWAVAGRAGFLRDASGSALAQPGPSNLVDLTGTVSFSPLSGLFLMLDNRADWSNRALFSKGASESSRWQLTTTLGAVLKY